MDRYLNILKSNRILIFFLLVTLGLGTASNLYLFQEHSILDLAGELWSGLRSPSLLLLVPVFTLMNIGLRYMKWVFLLRTFGLVFPSRTIFLYYMISFIGNLTPLYFLYLIRIIPLYEKRKNGILVLTLDIGLDFLAVLALSFVPSVILPTVLLFFLSVIAASVLRSTHANPISIQILSVLSMLCFSMTIWFITAVGLNLTLFSFGESIPALEAARILASSNLTAALSLIPAGVYINGQSMIQSLEEFSIPHETAMFVTALFRGMTLWLAVLLGLVTLFLFRRNLRSDLHAENHFNIIADEYGEQIPAHIRDKMLSRKITVNKEYFNTPDFKKGFDGGCGQGWYLERMTELGYTMKGVDFSAGQVLLAKKNNPSLPEKSIQQGSIAEIPFADSSFDFAYTINVLHHLPDRPTQLRAYDEFLRVLRPGGLLIIHEINVLNPLFRLYMSYIFPLINTIDEGTEIWILENDAELKRRFEVVGTEFFTFLPEFLPALAMKFLAPFERLLEQLPLTRRYSAHYALVLRKPQSSQGTGAKSVRGIAKKASSAVKTTRSTSSATAKSSTVRKKSSR